MLASRPWKDIDIRFRFSWPGKAIKPDAKTVWIRDGAVQIQGLWTCSWLETGLFPGRLCEACTVKNLLQPINACTKAHAGRISEQIRELKLSGLLPISLVFFNGNALCHSSEHALELCPLQPEILNIEIPWFFWHPVMLSSIDLTRLRSLKMPVRTHEDCIKIRAALVGLPKLGHLAINELCDSQEFVNEFHHLGHAISALSSSLRSLEICINNINRNKGWEKKEPFVEPRDIGYFFKEFFPEPSRIQVEALVRTRYADPREPLDVNKLRSFKGPLNLERIRLKHVGLPWWAFQTVFNPNTIKELDIPTCRVTPSVWDDLEKHARLQRLANINYEMLAGNFMSFLSNQHDLQFLSFARPPDIFKINYRVSTIGIRSSEETVFRVVAEAPHLGPGTEWGRSYARGVWLKQSSKSWIEYQYPRRSTFVKALSNKTKLKHLVLPADMFDITWKFMACLATELPVLESIEWAFDYNCPVRTIRGLVQGLTTEIT